MSTESPPVDSSPNHEIFNEPVQTQNGPVKGTIKPSRDPDRPFVAFMGLRYADPPDRFEVARKLQEKWTEPKIADKHGSICIQVGSDLKFVGTEDGLFLNLYVPKAHLESGLDKLPVMFWVHGGAFAFGEGHTYEADYFMENGDVILITVNYRLGGFGFLSTGDGIIPGNIGLRDLVQALEWVQENAAAFKGDPGNVTIFGESAGSVCVHYLLMSRLTKGLFHRAIMESGAVSCWNYDPYPRETAIKLAKHLEYDLPSSSSEPGKESVAIQDFLKNLPADEFGKAHVQFCQRWPAANTISSFLPTAVEPEENAFFSGTPELFLGPTNKISEYPNKVPVMVGVCKNEGSFLFLAFVMMEDRLLELAENWNEIAPKAFMFENYFPKENHSKVSHKIREFYFGTDEKDLNFEEKLLQLEELYTDSLFLLPAMYAGMEMVESGIEVYPFMFSYLGEWNIKKALQIPECIPNSVGHADEIQYLFPHEKLANRPLNFDDERFSKNMIKLWTSFAKTGKPYLDPEWTQATWDTLKVKPTDLTKDDDVSFFVLEIEKEPKMLNLNITRKLKFWKNLGEMYGFRSSRI